MKIILSLFFLITTQYTFAQTIYQWKDENGNIHFSQIPKTDTESKKITIQENEIDSDTALKNLQKKVDGFSERRKNNKLLNEKGEDAVKYKKELDSYCSVLKANIEVLTKNEIVMAEDTKKTMSDNEKKAELEKSKKQYSEKCN